jgi:hypothetical protein
VDAVDAEIGGYAEIRAGYLVDVDGVPWGLTERVRPSFTMQPTERITAEAVVEAAFAQGRNQDEAIKQILDDSDLAPMLDAYCTYQEPTPYDEIQEYLSVERLLVKFSWPAADLAIGRQAVNWGSAMAFHPTDAFAELLVTEPWRERRGINAVKANIPFLGDHQVTAVLATGDDLSPFTDDAAEFEDLPLTGAARLTLRAAGTDWTAVGWGRPDGDAFLGADLRGNLEVGWWAEGGWNLGEKDAPEVVAGLDYSFSVLQMLYVAAEYRYDGSGQADVDDYAWEARAGSMSVPYACEGVDLQEAEGGSRTTLGQHYVTGAARLGITEDLSVTQSVLVNAGDGTGTYIPDVGLLLGSRVTVHALAQIPFGAGGEFHPPESVTTLQSPAGDVDFSGLVPDATLVAWLRYSF